MAAIAEVNVSIKAQLADKFNVLIGEFVRKLISTFPANELHLKTVYNKLLLPIAITPTVPIEQFFAVIQPFNNLIEGKASEFFTTHASSISMFADMDMKSNWDASPEDTREAIWSYMNALLALAKTYTNVDVLVCKDVTNVAGIPVSDVSDMSSKMTKNFKSRHNREPNANDDVSEYSIQAAKDLGFELDDLSNIDLSTVEQQICNMELPMAGGKKINKREVKKINAFVMRQLKNLQRRQRLQKKLK